MARITRKKYGRQVEPETEKKKLYQVGIYARLSVKKEGKKVESIDTQIAICKEYISEHTDMVLADTYVDMGKSGMHFCRKGFEQMMKDIGEGRMNCIIAKDLSRIGRNRVEMGYYMENFFMEHQIRVIAVTDYFDSLLWREQEEILPLKNLVNEMYAKDISRKVASAKKIKWEQGEYTGGIPPYGYQLIKTGEKRKLEIEEETAEVVKKIYQWYLEGRSISEIVTVLEQERVSTPHRFRKRENTGEEEKIPVKRWSVSEVKHILTNPVYLGCMVKRETKGMQCKFCREEELESFGCLMQKNTHPPIVSKDVFFRAANRIW